MNAIRVAGIDISEKEVEKIVSSINLKGNGEINYSEFIAATLKVK